MIHVGTLDLYMLYKTSKMPNTPPSYLNEKKKVLKAIPK